MITLLDHTKKYLEDLEILENSQDMIYCLMIFPDKDIIKFDKRKHRAIYLENWKPASFVSFEIVPVRKHEIRE